MLYTTNHWGGIIKNWIQLQTVVIKDDNKLLNDTKTILQRLPNNAIYTDFVISITKEFTKINKFIFINTKTKKRFPFG